MEKNKDLVFEDAINRLEEIISLIDQGQVPLDDSLRFYEEAHELMSFCEKKLSFIETRMNALMNTNDETSSELEEK